MNKILFLLALDSQNKSAAKLQLMFNNLPKDYDLLFIIDKDDPEQFNYDYADMSYILDENPTGNLSDQLPKYAKMYADNYELICSINNI